jgi:hypothetical protein
MSEGSLNFNIEINDDKNSNNLIENEENKKENKKNQNKPISNNEDISIINYYNKSSHPIISTINLLFKLINIIIFIFQGLLIENDSIGIIFIIIIGSCDFWYTKNISGRFLVGLRWSNKIKENGNEVWIYESKNEENMNKSDTYIFWTCLYISNAFWIFCSFWEFIRFKFISFSVSFVLLIFNSSNLFGYLKCSKIQRQKIESIKNKFIGKVGKDVMMSQLNY